MGRCSLPNPDCTRVRSGKVGICSETPKTRPYPSFKRGKRQEQGRPFGVTQPIGVSLVFMVVCMSLSVCVKGQVQEWGPLSAGTAGEDRPQPASGATEGRQRDAADLTGGG